MQWCQNCRPLDELPVVAVVHSEPPKRTPVYLQLPGEERPIPVFPLAPGSGHQPFTVHVASPLSEPEPTAGTTTGASPTSFQPPDTVQSFVASDAGGTTQATPASPRPATPPDFGQDSFGAGFFESGAGFGRGPPQFPSFESVFEGAPSRRRGARKLTSLGEVAGVTAHVQADAALSHADGQVSEQVV